MSTVNQRRSSADALLAIIMLASIMTADAVAAVVEAPSARNAPAEQRDQRNAPQYAQAAVRSEPSPPRYEQTAPTPDGIGKRYMGREIARVMGWQGAEWLERAEREQEERTDLLLPQLKLEPGMRVADIGAGTGYIARRIAKLVGPSGSVDAVDVQPEMIRMLEAMAKREKLANIRAVLGGVADVKLAPSSVDLAIMVDVYHELEQPYELLASIVRALKPGGRVAFVEYKAEDPSIPIKPVHKMSVLQVKREAAAHPLEFERVVGTLPWQHIIVFRKTSRLPGG